MSGDHHHSHGDLAELASALQAADTEKVVFSAVRSIDRWVRHHSNRAAIRKQIRDMGTRKQLQSPHLWTQAIAKEFSMTLARLAADSGRHIVSSALSQSSDKSGRHGVTMLGRQRNALSSQSSTQLRPATARRQRRNKSMAGHGTSVSARSLAEQNKRAQLKQSRLARIHGLAGKRKHTANAAAVRTMSTASTETRLSRLHKLMAKREQRKQQRQGGSSGGGGAGGGAGAGVQAGAGDSQRPATAPVGATTRDSGGSKLGGGAVLPLKDVLTRMQRADTLADLFLDDRPPLVMDSGSCFVRLGLSGDSYPRSVWQTTLKPEQVYPSTAMDADMHRADALKRFRAQRPPAYKSSYVAPVVDGAIVDPVTLVETWMAQVDADLDGLDVADRMIIMNLPLVPSGDDVAFRTAIQAVQDVADELFGVHGVGGLRMEAAPVLALAAQGRTSGCVVCMGESTTGVFPVVDGTTLLPGCRSCPINGATVTQHFWRSLSTGFGSPLSNFKQAVSIRRMKERCAFVANNYLTELGQATLVPTPGVTPRAPATGAASGTAGAGAASGAGGGAGAGAATDGTALTEQELVAAELAAAKANMRSSYTLPDGTSVKVGHRAFSSCELYFRTALDASLATAGGELPGVVTEVLNSVPSAYQSLLRGNVALCGGAARAPGMRTRLDTELNRIAGTKGGATVTNCEVRPEFRLGAAGADASVRGAGCSEWLGASVVASLSTTCRRYVTYDEWMEEGPSICLRKFDVVNTNYSLR